MREKYTLLDLIDAAIAEEAVLKKSMGCARDSLAKEPKKSRLTQKYLGRLARQIERIVRI